jgi:hypothetical protein
MTVYTNDTVDPSWYGAPGIAVTWVMHQKPSGHICAPCTCSRFLNVPLFRKQPAEVGTKYEHCGCGA